MFKQHPTKSDDSLASLLWLLHEFKVIGLFAIVGRVKWQEYRERHKPLKAHVEFL